MDPLALLLKSLHAEGRLRVWSLVITVFGDCVQHRGGRIATARLGALLGRAGVETGALRTALSRLARDGWVEGQRTGRTSSYILSHKGRERFGPATSQIYAPPRAPVEEWLLVRDPGGTGISMAGGLLRPTSGPVPPGARILMRGTLGADARAAVVSSLADGHRAALLHLAGDLAALGSLPDDPHPLDAVTARVLLIHRWRRLVLRWPDLPPDLMPDDIDPPDLHARVAALYHRLSPAAEAWLGADIDGLDPMPAPSPRIPMRFGRPLGQR